MKIEGAAVIIKMPVLWFDVDVIGSLLMSSHFYVSLDYFFVEKISDILHKYVPPYYVIKMCRGLMLMLLPLY